MPALLRGAAVASLREVNLQPGCALVLVVVLAGAFDDEEEDEDEGNQAVTFVCRHHNQSFKSTTAKCVHLWPNCVRA